MSLRQTQELARLLENKPQYAGKLLYVDAANKIKFTKKLSKRIGCLGCAKKVFWQTRAQTLCGDGEHQFLNNIPSQLEEKLNKLSVEELKVLEGLLVKIHGEKA